MWQVHKFGGSSLKSIESVKQVKLIVEKLRSSIQDFHIAIVFSAFYGVTDRLIRILELAKKRDESYKSELELLRELHIKNMQGLISDAKLQSVYIESISNDFNDLEDLLRAVWLSKSVSVEYSELISGYGEVWSTKLMNLYLHEYDPLWLDARKILIAENSPTGVIVDWTGSQDHLNAVLQGSKTNFLVITGFIASNSEGIPITLKRNGSDLSASIFAVLLKASEVTIWKDVDGVFSADPLRVPEAVVLTEMSYLEALELAYFGAKVLHPGTILPAMNHHIPIIVRNSYNITSPGTRIYLPHTKITQDKSLVKGFATISDLAILNLEGAGMIGVPGIAQKMFSTLREVGISVIMISQASSEYSISVVVDQEVGKKGRIALEDAFESEIRKGHIQSVSSELNCGVLAVVGDNMVNQPGIAAILFSALGASRINVRMISQGSSERNISVILKNEDLTKALRSVQSAFYLSNLTLSVGIIGVGLIGSELIEQIQEQKEYLRKNLNISLKITGIANSKSMLVGDDIILNSWKQDLKIKGQELDYQKFVSHINTQTTPHSVIIDCTASQLVTDMYVKWLNSGIHIITANKKGSSGDISYYKSLEKFIRVGPSTDPIVKTTHYFYETTVGAGLPIISVIQDLLKTGDEILKIEGVFSGTISYIFNNLSISNKFSSIVKEAKNFGYTEPDPRDDLSGLDFARKMVILGRELGLSLQLQDVEIEPIISEELFSLNSIDDFFNELPNVDEDLLNKVILAKENHSVLRYVGTVSLSGSCKLALQEFKATHPFANLKDGENIVVITSKRYKKFPLVVQGPGAGAEVTASGVFSELLRLADLLGS